MPYVNQEARDRLSVDPSAKTAGELNYLFTETIIWELNRVGISYGAINTIIGELTELQQEEFSLGIIRHCSDLQRELNRLSCRFEGNSKKSEIIGALECCKLELYRRIAAPYEDIKIGENGDVY